MESSGKNVLFDLSWAIDALDGDVGLLKEVVSDVMDETPGQLDDLEIDVAKLVGYNYLRG